MPRESHQHPVQMPAEVASTGLDPLHLSARSLPADPSGPKAPDRIAHPGCCPGAPTPPPCGVNRQAGRPVSSGQSQEALPCASPHLSLPPGRKGGADVKARAAPARGSQGAGWARGRGWGGPCQLHPVGPHQSGAEEVCFLFYIPRCWLGSSWTQPCRVKCKPHAYRPLTDGCHCQLRAGQKFSPNYHTCGVAPSLPQLMQLLLWARVPPCQLLSRTGRAKDPRGDLHKKHNPFQVRNYFCKKRGKKLPHTSALNAKQRKHTVRRRMRAARRKTLLQVSPGKVQQQVVTCWLSF